MATSMPGNTQLFIANALPKQTGLDCALLGSCACCPWRKWLAAASGARWDTSRQSLEGSVRNLNRSTGLALLRHRSASLVSVAAAAS
jgi:hypothetical protein